MGWGFPREAFVAVALRTPPHASGDAGHDAELPPPEMLSYDDAVKRTDWRGCWGVRRTRVGPPARPDSAAPARMHKNTAEGGCWGVVACSDCGTIQRLPVLDSASEARCRRCGMVLQHSSRRSVTAGLACATAALVLLIVGNLMPSLRSHLLAATTESRVIDGSLAYWHADRPLMAAFVAAFVVAIPLSRSAMLVGVLGSLRLGWRGSWQAPVLRWAEALRLWSMAPVYVAAGLVTYGRVAAQLNIEILPAGWAFVAGALLLLVAEAAYDTGQVWQDIMPDPAAPPPGPAFGCASCGFVVPAAAEGGRCPRCRHRLRRRKPHLMRLVGALTLAGFVLYPAALFLPMTQTMQPGGVVERNIIDGVTELFSRGFWYFGIVIFIASIAVPVSKLVVLAWLMLRMKYPRMRGLVLRTRLHRIIDEINRWSFVDPFIVAMTAPLMVYPGIANVHAGPGTLPFALVVVLTMLASSYFDTRLMWDAAEGADE
jgi:paraquat-inducible protein A